MAFFREYCLSCCFVAITLPQLSWGGLERLDDNRGFKYIPDKGEAFEWRLEYALWTGIIFQERAQKHTPKSMLNFAEKPHVTVSKVFRVTLAEEKNTTDFSLGSEDAFIVLLDSTKGSMKPLFIFYSKDPISLSFPFQEKKEHWLTVQVPDNFENNTNTSVKLTYTKKEEWIDPRHQKMEIGEKTSEKVVTRYDGQYPEYVTLFSYTITLDLLATIQESLDIN